MKCDDCVVEFPPGEVKHAYYGACFCRACWAQHLPNDCFDCGQVKRHQRMPDGESFTRCGCGEKVLN